jgi:hypothetical protein
VSNEESKVTDAPVAKSKVAKSKAVKFLIRKFPKEELCDLLECSKGEEMDGYTMISDKIIDNDRWAIRSELTFKYDDKYYIVHYRRGATELQDEYPFDDCGDLVECMEAERHAKPVYYYIPIVDKSGSNNNDLVNTSTSL